MDDNEDMVLVHSSEVVWVPEDSLAHYGVTGMRWGKRSGGLKSRIKGSALDSVQRRQTTNNAIAKGEGTKTDKFRVGFRRAAGYATFNSKKLAGRRVNTLEARKQRIESGKIKARDVVDFLANTSVADLVVSRQDKRA